jgi:hypothetical protein
MRSIHRICAAGLLVAGLLTPTWGDNPPGGSADPIRVKLDDAERVNTRARQQAADALRAACDAAVRSAVEAKQTDQATELKTQEAAFTAGGTLPASPAVEQAVADYREAVGTADSNLDRAFVRAVRHYGAQGDTDKAIAVEQEKTKIGRQHSGGPAVPVEASGAPGDPAGKPEGGNPEQALAAAKVQYRADADDAMKTLVAKVDARFNAVTDAGDLQPAQALRSMEEALKTTGQVPDNPADPAVATAVTHYRHAIATANVRMARAYTAAVHGLTRARQLDLAADVQKEFIATELSGIDLAAAAESPPADNTYLLGRTLPELLTTAEHWDMHPRGGIFLQRRAFIRTKNGDFLNRDFTCDLWFTTESTGTGIFIGIGDGRGRPTEDFPINSLALCVNSPDVNGGAVGFLRPDGQIDTIGQLNAAGEYVARIERAGKVVSLSIGDEDADGTFNPKFSTAVSDTAVLAPFMTNHNAHLFFGGGRFWKIRFINGKPPAVIPDGVVGLLVK